MSLRRWLLALPLLFILLAAAGIAAVLRFVDLAPYAARHAGAAIAREVRIGALNLGWREGILLRIEDLHLAGPDWGTEPEMLRVGRIEAEIAPWSLVSGPLRLRRLVVEDVDAFLERGPGRRGNWHFGDAPLVPPDAAAVIAERARLPVLLDAALREGRLRYRTSSGAVLRIGARSLTAAAADEASPIRVVHEGSYDDTPFSATVDAGSFAELRGPDPLPMRIAGSMAGARLTFDGTATAPLDLDGARGRATLATEDFAALLAAFGVDGAPGGLAVDVASNLAHDGDRWELRPLTGRAAGARIAGLVRVEEGRAGVPDRVTLDLGADRLDVQALFGSGSTPGGDWQAMPIAVERRRGTHLQGQVAADQLVLGPLTFRDAILRGRLESGLVEVEQFAFGQAGGRVRIMAAVRAEGDAASRLTLRVDAEGLDAAQLAESASLQSARISGQAMAGLTLDVTGETLGAALRAGRGQAVVAMTEGRIARSALEAASTNILALFRDQDGTARIRCLLAGAELRDGRLLIQPLRLRATEGTISGGGSIDLARQRIDLLIGSESRSTGFFALDIPIRISGPLRNPDIGPSRGTPPRRSSLTEAFPAEQRTLAERSGCLR